MNTSTDACKKENKCYSAETNAGTSDPTDGRERYEWTSRYPDPARKIMLREALFLFFILFTSLFLLFATWKGWICFWPSSSTEEALTLKKYAFYASSGMLGGIVFSMKYFYRVVARGYWHQDRRYWRIMSPFIAMIISIMVGAMIDASVMNAQKPVSGAAVVSIGFLAGYFADEAVGKMYEIASVIFGKSAMTKSGDGYAHDGKEKNC